MENYGITSVQKNKNIIERIELIRYKKLLAQQLNFILEIIKIFLVLCVIKSPQASAQMDDLDYKTAPLAAVNSHRPYETEFEKISLKDEVYDLDLSFGDIVVPGNGGLDIVVERAYNHVPDPRWDPAFSYSDDQHLPVAAKLMGDFWDISLPAIIIPHRGGTGGEVWFKWADLNLPAHTSKNSCNYVAGYKSNIALYISENGIRSVKALHKSPQTESQFSEITKDNWKAECVTSTADGTSGRIVYSPDGKRYAFTYDLNRGSWLIKKVTDRNGNWLEYNYGPAPSDGWSTPLLNTITANDGRLVQFNYQTILGRPHVSSIVSGSQRVDYEYEVYSEGVPFWFSLDYSYPGVYNSRTRLKRVVRADGTSWTFDYETSAWFYALKSISTPAGGIISYKHNGDSLQQRETSGAIPASTWSFDYPYHGTPFNYITGPGFCEKRESVRSSPSADPKYLSALWNRGLPVSITTYSDSACTLEVKKEAFQYDKRQITPFPKTIDCTSQYPKCKFGDPVTYAPVQTLHAITQDGQSYSTTISGWDSYGNPTTVVENGANGGDRTTNISYYINTTKWIFQPSAETSPGSNRSRTFDGNGNVTQIIQDGITTNATYDGQGNVSSITYPRSLTTYFSNYKRGKAQTENQPESISISRTIDDSGNITSETNGEGYTTTYTYDGLNRVKSITPPIGAVKNFNYGAASKTVTRGTLVETTQYDGLYRPRSVTLGGISTTYEYDTLGRTRFVSNPGTVLGTSYEHDVLNRVTKQINADGTFRTNSYSGATTTTVDERGYATTNSYRAYGDPSKQWLMSVTAADPAANITILRNNKDLVTSATQGGLTRTYGYNSNYYLTSINNPETGLTVLGRDAAGNQTSRQVGSSGVTLYSYDGKNRLTSVTYPGSTPSVANTYNKTNKLLASNSSAANRSYVYDANGNLTSESITVDAITFTAGYTYNSLDQLSTLTYPQSGTVVNYYPDVLGRPTKVSGYVNGVSYWPSGQVKQINYANNTITSYWQNARLWPSTFKTQVGSLFITNGVYSYDGVGNLTSISDTTDTTRNRVVGYDSLSRLTSITGTWGNGTITYDGVGNIGSQTFGSYKLNYSYDASNRLSSLLGNRNATYSYDVYGNIINDGTNTFIYDDVPNLRHVNYSGTTNKIEYTYDATGQRVTVNKAGIKSYEFFGTDGKQLIEFTPSQSNKLVEYFYLGGKRVAQRVTP